MMSAISARQHNPLAEITLIEKNGTLGRKMSISGGGRCNITNTCDTPTLISKIQTNPRFLYSALTSFDSIKLLKMLNSSGLPTKVEDNGRVFPVSDKATDVIETFEKQLINIKIQYFTTVVNIKKEKNKFVVKTVKRNNGKTITNNIYSEKVIIATGGLSASPTGSTGDGYKFAQSLSHTLTKKFYPAVVPLKTKESWSHSLQGLSLRNVGVTTKVNKKIVFRDIGDMVFAHFGVSGPVILRASAHITGKHFSEPHIFLDFFPEKKELELEQELLNIFQTQPNKNTKNSLEDILPKKSVTIISELSNIHLEKKNRDIKKEERRRLIENIKSLKLTVTGDMGFNNAIATNGGVSVKEINPTTMESKLVDGLYIVGEVLDVNAYTGGYNLQIAYSTGYSAGKHAAKTI